MVAVMTQGEIRYVRVPVFSASSPLSDVVEIAFPLEGEAPVTSDWHTAEWTPGQTWVSGDSVEARILVGSTVSLVAGTYETWIRITAGGEQPWLQAGLLAVRSASGGDSDPQSTLLPITIVQGATFSQEFPWREGGVPQSLAGFSAKFAIAKRRGTAADPLIEVDSSGAEVILEPPDDDSVPRTGIIWVRLAPSTTEQLTKVSGVYDLWIINTGDPTEVFRLYEGAVTVDRQASEAE